MRLTPPPRARRKIQVKIKSIKRATPRIWLEEGGVMEDKCEIVCLTCGNKVSVTIGDEEVNWTCPVCALQDQVADLKVQLTNLLDKLHEDDGTIATLRTQLADLQEVLADKRRLTRELDIALSGEKDAAQQAALCDLIPAAKQLRAQLAAAEARAEGMREGLFRADGNLSLLRHWAEREIPWGTKGIPTKQEMDCLIGEIRNLSKAILTPAAGEWVAVRRELWKEALALVAEHPGTLTPGYWKDRINKFFAEVDKAALAGGKE